MAILKIARMGHPVLRRVAVPVTDPTTPELRRLVSDMWDTLNDADGAGLAAPQVYASVRLVIFRLPPERCQNEPEAAVDATVLFNPEIKPLGDDAREGMEGCLSLPTLRGIVPRHLKIRYRGIDAEGEPIERVATGFHARVVQHEVDHLDGILYPERMSSLRMLSFEDQWRHFLAGMES